MSDHRLTIIARDGRKPDLDWTHTPVVAEALMFIDSTEALGAALRVGAELGLDIGRVIIDRAGTPDEFLRLLTALPTEFCGDVLFIREDGSGVMSATGRGGDRVLYGLDAHNVRFYLETWDLVTGRMAIARTA